jgi:hypothetical protein
MEIYKEECYDLLSPQRQKCDIREGSKGDTYVEGLTSREVLSSADVQIILFEVAKIRATGKTAMNSQSSRSHAICTFTLNTVKEMPSAVENGVGTYISSSSSLHLVDLAGSERAKKTQASGDAFSEGVNINKGLLALGNVIVALASQNSPTSGGPSSHIPYRDSKITRILKDSLGGNSLTVMIACVSPADTNFEETLNTLRFASRTSCIVNNASMSKDYGADGAMTGAASAELIQEICQLREQLMLMKTEKSDSRALVLPMQINTIPLELVFRMNSFLKSILIKCLEEDVAVDDTEIERARGVVAAFRSHLSDLSSSSSLGLSLDGMALEFLPPLMKLIEDLESFDTFSQQRLGSVEEEQTGERLSHNSNSSGGSYSSNDSTSLRHGLITNHMESTDG